MTDKIMLLRRFRNWWMMERLKKCRDIGFVMC